MQGAGALQVRIARARLLAAYDPRAKPAVDLGQDDMHGKIGRRQAAFRPGPGGLRRGRQRHLEHRAIGRIQGRAARRVPRRKGGGVDDGRRRQRIQRRPHPFPDAWRLERGHEQPRRRKAARAQGRDQGADWLGVPGRQPGAIEDDGHGRPLAHGRRRNDAPVGIEPAAIGQGLALRRWRGLKPRRPGQRRKRRPARIRPARPAQVREFAQHGNRQRGQVVETRILGPIAGQDRKRDPLPAGQVLHRHQAVGPIAFPADQPDQNGPGARQRAFDIGIDRHRMAQRRKVRKPQPGQRPSRRPGAMPALGKAAEVAVRKRQHHQIGRVLAQIGRHRRILKPKALAKDDVHQRGPCPLMARPKPRPGRRAAARGPGRPFPRSPPGARRAGRSRAGRTDDAPGRPPPAPAAASACPARRHGP